MKLWRKLLAAVTAGTICLGSIGAMLSVSAETELDSSAVSENSTEVKASKGAHTHYYGELASSSDGCAGWYFYCVGNNGVNYDMMGDPIADKYAINNGFVPNALDTASGWVWLGTNPPTITTTKVTTKTTTKMTTKTTTTTTQPSVPTVKEGSLDKGDIDGSGSLDSTDVYIANTAVGNTVKISKEQVTAADVDESSSVDATDVYYLMYYIALHGVGVNVSWDDVLAK